MAEKTAAENSQLKKERFEFVFTINGNIVCQRYFHINRFKEASLGSNELRNTVYDCAKLIKNDLKAKSNIYCWYAEPQHFKNEAQMHKWEARPTFRLKVPTFVVLDDSGETYVWNGNEMEAYGKAFAKVEDDAPCILKFAFLDNGEEISSYSWDAKVYPKFVRTNIDLSNSSNRYANDAIHAPMEEFLMERFIASQENLIPTIIRTLCCACSFSDAQDYSYELTINTGADTYAEYGYPASFVGSYRNMVRQLERTNREKTKKYFRDL